MKPGIENSRGKEIGYMEISTDSGTDGTKLKKVNLDLKDSQSSFRLPVHGDVDSIDLFGLPPFNEWAIGVNSLEKLESEAELKEEKHSEKFRSRLKTRNRARLELKRRRKNFMENYQVEEFLTPSENTSIGIFDVEHSNGSCHYTVEREVARNKTEIKRMKQELKEDEKNYFQGVSREERVPDLMILKKVQITGRSPAVLDRLYSGWEVSKFENASIRILELGYFDYGDNETEFDRKHGRWYKLLNSPSLEHETMEVREGNWKSETLEKEGKTFNHIGNYEKYLYSLEAV